MAITRFHAILIDKVGDKVLSLRNEIASGHLPDYAAYNKQCGRVAGLIEALGIAEEIEGEFDAGSGPS